MVHCGNCVGLETFKPDRDDVLEAIAIGGRNVIYLDPDVEFDPTGNEEQVSSVLSQLTNCAVSGVDVLAEPETSSDTDYLTLGQISEALDPHLFMRKMVSQVMISDVKSGKLSRADPSVQVSSVEAKTRHSRVTPERISQIFGCGLSTARETIRVTTQSGVRNAVRPLTRRYRTDLLSLNYRRLKTEMHTDTMHFKVKSLSQNKCTQIYSTKSWARAYPIRSESEAGNTL